MYALRLIRTLRLLWLLWLGGYLAYLATWGAYGVGILGPLAQVRVGALFLGDVLVGLGWVPLVVIPFVLRGLKVVLRRRLDRLDYIACPQCAYDLHGCDSFGPCPECGTTYSVDCLRTAWVRQGIADERSMGPAIHSVKHALQATVQAPRDSAPPSNRPDVWCGERLGPLMDGQGAPGPRT